MNKTLIKCTFAAALGGLLFGYDTVIINGAMLDLVKYFQLTPVIQGWTVSSALVGCIIGTIFIGKPGDIYGAKRLLQLLSIMFFASSVGCGLAPNISIFILFRFIGGLAIGGASVISSWPQMAYCARTRHREWTREQSLPCSEYRRGRTWHLQGSHLPGARPAPLSRRHAGGSARGGH